MTQAYLMNTHLAILGHGTNFWVNQKQVGAGQIFKTFSNLISLFFQWYIKQPWN